MKAMAYCPLCHKQNTLAMKWAMPHSNRPRTLKLPAAA
jgi:hypothetical protein